MPKQKTCRELNDISRRQFLKNMILLFGAIIGSSTFLNACRGTKTSVISTQPVPTETTNVTTPSITTSTETATAPPTTTSQNPSDIYNIDITKYRLTVGGLVNNPLSLSYEELMQYPPIAETVTITCPGYFSENRDWVGVPVSTILSEASIGDTATKVTFYSVDGYKSQWSPYDSSLFLAYTVDGQTLPKDNGFPIRLVVPQEIGAEWVDGL